MIGEDPDCIQNQCAPQKITRKPVKIIVHEDYDHGNPTSPYDIALIRLDEPLTLFYENPILSSIIPVCLSWPETNSEIIMNKELRGYITGWGRVTNDLFKGIE